MKKILIIISAVVILVGAWFLLGSDKFRGGSRDAVSNGSKNAGTVQKDFSEGEAKVFQINASNYKYDVKEIRVKKGDKVKIVLNVNQGLHDLVLNEFGIASEKTQTGGIATMEFVADKEGKFEYYCSIGTHRQMGMFGTLIVE